MLQQGKVIDVRGVLERNCTTTSVDELRSQGRSRVKVINAKQISALIEEAVARTVEAKRSAKSGGDSQNNLVDASRAEFQKLVAEREKELREVRAAMDAVEREREALRKEVQQKAFDLLPRLKDYRGGAFLVLACNANLVPGNVLGERNTHLPFAIPDKLFMSLGLRGW